MVSKAQQKATFQLTRSRGAWLSSHYRRTCRRYNFNSHAHVERDDKTTLKGVAGKDFNSHAHVERDSFSYIIQIRKKNFNSHAHVERDLQTKTENLDLKKFQLTRSRGAWRVFEIFVKFFTNFNSHAHVERDWLHWIFFPYHNRFQLTRSRGAWLYME